MWVEKNSGWIYLDVSVDKLKSHVLLVVMNQGACYKANDEFYFEMLACVLFHCIYFYNDSLRESGNKLDTQDASV